MVRLQYVMHCVTYSKHLREDLVVLYRSSVLVYDYRTEIEEAGVFVCGEQVQHLNNRRVDII